MYMHALAPDLTKNDPPIASIEPPDVMVTKVSENLPEIELPPVAAH